MWISILPVELWIRILETGISSSDSSNLGGGCGGLNFRDLCSLSITCKRLNALISNHHSLWSSLLAADFNLTVDSDHHHPPPATSSSPPSYKALYRIRYERKRDQKRLAHRRVVLSYESEIAVRSRKIATIKLQLSDEREKMRITLAELHNLSKARQASIALNVWQPEVILSKQKQMVQQCDVPIDTRISALEMELRLCKQQIANYDIALKAEKRMLDKAKETLKSVKYHPLHDFSFKGNQSEEHVIRRKNSKHA